MPHPRLLTVLTLAAALAGCDLPFGLGSEDDLAPTEAVERWVSSHPDGWNLELRSDLPLARPAWAVPCSSAPPSGFAVLRYAAPDTEIDLHFACPPAGSAAEPALSSVVLQRLPHGIRSRGWRFDVLTPSSHVQAGVRLTREPGGRIRVELETPLFAVYGHSEEEACQPPADGSSAPGCYLSRKLAIPLRLVLLAPSSAASIR